MTTQEKIEKAITAQNCLSGIEYCINGDFATFTRPEESAKYQQVGKIRISDGKCFPFSYHTRTSRERDAVNFLGIVSLAIISEKFPEEDTRPNFFIQF